MGYFYALNNVIFSSAGFSPIFRFLLTEYDKAFAWLGLAVCFLALWWKNPGPIFRLVDTLACYPRTFAAASVLPLAICSVFIYHRYPLSMDEYAAVFQSKIFAAAQLSAHFPPQLVDWLIAPGFNGRFLVASPITGQAIEAYWPGFSILLSPFQLLGAGWLCNPLLAAASLYLTYRITFAITQSQRAGGFALLFCVGSGAFSAYAISFYSMQAHLTANLLFVWLLLNPSRYRAFTAGVVGSFALVLHNPIPHTLFALPWIAAMALNKEQRRYLPYLLLGYLPLSIALGIGWFVLRGMIHPNFNLVPDVRGFQLLRWPDAAMLNRELASWVKSWVWAVPGLFVLAVFGFRSNREDRTVRLLALSAMLTVGGYLFVNFDQGHGWGYRYFHSAWAVVPVLAACGVKGRAESSWQLAPFGAAAAALSILLIVPFQLSRIDVFITTYLQQLPAAKRPGNNVYFIPLDRGFYLADAIQADPLLREPDLLLVSHGEARDSEFVRRYWPNAVRAGGNGLVEQWYLGDVERGGPSADRMKRFLFNSQLLDPISQGPK